jgi:dTDP-4-amino-4,6-dideoxygalactose transaminase
MQALIIILQKRLVSNQTELQEGYGFGPASQFPIFLNTARLSKDQFRQFSSAKAILPVHLYGQCCDMDAILAVARRHGVAVVEDACHAVGAEYKGRKAGSMGITACFSFHEQKNISTLGEGGMVVTNDPAVFERVALYRSHCTRVHDSGA